MRINECSAIYHLNTDDAVPRRREKDNLPSTNFNGHFLKIAIGANLRFLLATLTYIYIICVPTRNRNT